MYFSLFLEREKSFRHEENPVEPISSYRDESGYVPTVGRWGSEWPSWLETTEVWCQPQGQARGPRIRGVPLPLPVWAHYESPTLTVDTVEQYEELAGAVELETRRLLRENRYDTVDNFLRYIKEFIIVFISVLYPIIPITWHFLFLIQILQRLQSKWWKQAGAFLSLVSTTDRTPTPYVRWPWVWVATSLKWPEQEISWDCKWALLGVLRRGDYPHIH